MKRRGFLSMVGAAGLAPVLPSLAVPTPGGVGLGAYARAVMHARTRSQISAKGLAFCLKISAGQAEALMGRLASKGVIQPIAGTARAASTITNPTIWGREHAAAQRLPGARAKPTSDVQPSSTYTKATQQSGQTIRSNPMEKYQTFTGIAAPMPLVNIDTDMIIPKQFLKTIKRSGLGVNLFDEMRYDDDGNEIPDFVLNKDAYRNAEVIVAGDNFGCGSSREHAPWALKDFGIKAVISTSFADIFHNNCFKNGILPISLPEDAVNALMKDAEKGANARMTINLEEQTVTSSDGESFSFDIDPFKKQCLLDGLDDIGLTLEKAGAIETFEAAAAQARPWV